MATGDALRKLFEQHGYTFEIDADGAIITDAPDSFLLRIDDDGSLYELKDM